MPWHREAMKDAAICEKLRGADNELRSEGVRMGKPGGSHIPSFIAEYIGDESERGELKHLSIRGKRNQKRFRK